MATNFDTPLATPSPSFTGEITYPDDVGPEGIEVLLEEEGSVEVEIPPAFDANLAETMSERDLNKLSTELMDLFEQDLNSRKDWVTDYVAGMKVLGTSYEERTEPWDGACGVYSTILTEAAIRFQADTITETFPAAGPVKTKIIGKETPEKNDAADRVREDMNYQLTEVMTEYRPEHERMLYSLGLAGCSFKKVYFDPSKKRQTAIYVPAEDVVMPFGCSSAADSERVTHIMRKTPNEVQRLQVKGFYRDVDLGEPRRFISDIEEEKAKDEGYSVIDDDRYQMLEIHVNMELPGGDSYDPAADDEDNRLPLPYVVTIERGTAEVVAVRRNWEQEDDTLEKRQHFVQYNYIPGFGAYGMGLIHVIGGYARAGTSIIRQLVDAGTLSNLPGGMKTRGMRTKGDDTPISPGEFRDVDVPSGSLRDNIMPLPYKEPSQVLLALLNQITDEGRRLGSIADMQVGDMSANAPVGTTLALLERQLKTMSAVQARVHFSMKQEFKLLKEIISENTPDSYSYDPGEGDRKAKRADYEMVEVIPVSDPNSATMSQRIMQWQAVSQLAAQAPQIYDLPYLHRKMVTVLGITEADKLIPGSKEEKPKDPVSENMAIITGKPVKAFLAQDHDAHIAVHTSMLQDPKVMSQMGQSPMAQSMQAAAMAHIAEHLAFQYRAGVEQQLGVALPPPDAELDPKVEAQLAPLVAQAATQLLQVNQKQAAQAQAQEQAADPVLQLQQKEVQIKESEVQRKAAKDQMDNEIARDKMYGEQELKEQQLQVDAQKVGVMGRAQDQGILAQDRQAAAALEQQIAQWDTQNSLGAEEAKHQQALRQQAEQAQQQAAIKAQQDQQAAAAMQQKQAIQAQGGSDGNQG
jgi:hypothetical protein